MTKGSRRNSRSPTSAVSRDGQTPGVSKKDSKVVKKSAQSRRVYFTTPVPDNISFPPNQHSVVLAVDKTPCSKSATRNHSNRSLVGSRDHSSAEYGTGKLNSHKRTSSQRRKQLLFRRLRAKDSKILHYLKSRPPPPTVGSSCLMMDVNEDSDDCVDTMDELMIPEPFTQLFDQQYSQNLTKYADASVDLSADGDVKAIEKLSPSHCQTAPVDSSQQQQLLPGATSIDLFGSYWQDYNQSDYVNNTLFDENMLIC
mmetsp:Transcript_19138/g.32035  ORF Transcript_19138/g.32035 Transcript_19138/m.32035 type:complete len:255 (+) Transcript_19138:52-816(+)|eukprot:CAMPEP_0114424182 /NCGR_PEP_ID=MMETSP0103-20121206/6556_1 /TAXON_ID=37642 ORGANISM="Paraphysomonas imperforata, Strain PA2" /NCGR_SAMPLE_ID=MMETSP0103 /ASSEMBLY_ACC=CAM_ASM_000201 /LENGTH=254 /DNA_ID=CAMNT_0001592915 /DNA_START=52 /DNA_END=816 /DNA_ORIENTATION=-